ncbi:MAG TPA: cytochrome C oxidase subunit I [Burkholderiales bacterium]|nr:cytochrome C oxidase subunit I [Burkholderiales bacterium]
MRNKILLIGLVCAAPLVLGTLAYVYKWDVGSAANYGELLPPRLLAGSPFERLRGKWLLITVDASACDAWCEKKLYYLRQLRRAQGKDMNRVERLWLVTDGGKPRPGLLPAIEGTLIEPAPALDAFPGKPPDHLYVVDPLGNLMMRYPRDADPSRMLKDLQRLMKFARPG